MPASSCPRCHLEPAVDVHERVRRSQSSAAALDVFVQEPLGRNCHDWVTQHPTLAREQGWAIWGWEYAQQNAGPEPGATATVPDVADNAEDPDELVPITLRLPRSLLTGMDKRAGRFNLSRNRWAEFALQRVVDMPTQVTRGGTRRF